MNLLRACVARCTSRLARRAERARHNDHDYACRYWWGDRRANPDDLPNRDFTGKATLIMDRRCVVCRPYTDAEAEVLLGYDPITAGDPR